MFIGIGMSVVMSKELGGGDLDMLWGVLGGTWAAFVCVCVCCGSCYGKVRSGGNRHGECDVM